MHYKWTMHVSKASLNRTHPPITVLIILPLIALFPYQDKSYHIPVGGKIRYISISGFPVRGKGGIVGICFAVAIIRQTVFSRMARPIRCPFVRWTGRKSGERGPVLRPPFIIFSCHSLQNFSRRKSSWGSDVCDRHDR
jgi:hypothetical protein